MGSHFLPRKSSILASSTNFESHSTPTYFKPRFTFERRAFWFREELLPIFEIKLNFNDCWTNCKFLLEYSEMIVLRYSKGHSRVRRLSVFNYTVQLMNVY